MLNSPLILVLFSLRAKTVAISPPPFLHDEIAPLLSEALNSSVKHCKGQSVVPPQVPHPPV